MPEAGGTYLYIDRAMGPLMGTIAGFGVWFSLVFKASFALVGLSAYLEFFFEHDERLVAAALAVVLIIINLIGVRATAGFQAVLVSSVLLLLAGFVLLGAPNTEAARYEPFLPAGIKGLLSATGLVFVSYIGVTKVASVAEEVRRPGRNLPLSILTSVGIAIVLYPAVVAVMVGVTPADELATTETPLLTAAEQFLGSVGIYVVAGVAVLALVFIFFGSLKNDWLPQLTLVLVAVQLALSVFSRGDYLFTPVAHTNNGNWPQTFKASSINPHFYVHRRPESPQSQIPDPRSYHLLLSLGSNASLSASPIKFQASTNNTIQPPGMATVYQNFRGSSGGPTI